MKKLLTLLCLFALSASVCLAEVVVFNTKTLKIHKPSCPSAQICTVNCVKIEKSQAKAKGGVPCKKCGG